MEVSDNFIVPSHWATSTKSKEFIQFAPMFRNKPCDESYYKRNVSYIFNPPKIILTVQTSFKRCLFACIGFNNRLKPQSCIKYYLFVWPSIQPENVEPTTKTEAPRLIGPLLSVNRFHHIEAGTLIIKCNKALNSNSASLILSIYLYTCLRTFSIRPAESIALSETWGTKIP